jgi:hypothetical protein
LSKCPGRNGGEGRKRGRNNQRESGGEGQARRRTSQKKDRETWDLGEKAQKQTINLLKNNCNKVKDGESQEISRGTQGKRKISEPTAVTENIENKEKDKLINLIIL